MKRPVLRSLYRFWSLPFTLMISCLHFTANLLFLYSFSLYRTTHTREEYCARYYTNCNIFAFYIFRVVYHFCARNLLFRTRCPFLPLLMHVVWRNGNLGCSVAPHDIRYSTFVDSFLWGSVGPGVTTAREVLQTGLTWRGEKGMFAQCVRVFGWWKCKYTKLP